MNIRFRTNALAALAMALAAPVVLASEHDLRFDGAIGSAPVGRINNNATATPTSDDFPEVNTIHGVSPGGAPWTIAEFRARIGTDGRARARGEGLLLSGGNNFGTRGGPRQVVLSLFCRSTPVPPATAGTPIGPFNSAFVDLDPNGDFEIDSVLRDANGATPPAPCGDAIDNRPTLLIRTVTNSAPGAWFAAGVLSR